MTDGYKAFLMIDYDTPDLIKKLHSQIPDEELYYSDDNPYTKGREMETHVTLVPCLADNTNLEDIKKHLLKLAKYELLLTNISVFENDDCDVLKCDVYSNFLHDTNSRITQLFDTRSGYDEYHPHVTIAYLQPGMGAKYKRDILSPLVVLKPTQFHYSWHDENGDEYQEYFQV